MANDSYIVTLSIDSPTSTAYPSNLLIERWLASADNDFHMPKRQSVNMGTGNTEISTPVPLDSKISQAFSTMDDVEMAVAGAISSTFLLMQLIPILIC